MTRRIVSQRDQAVMAVGAILRWAGIEPDAQFGADAMRAINQSKFPGITVHQYVGDAPHSGYMVSMPGYEQDQSFSRLDPKAIREYITKHKDVIDLPDHYYGGWEDDGRWYHDVSRNFQDEQDATVDAIRGQQQAVYDLNKDEPVWTHEMLDRISHPGIMNTWVLGKRQPGC